MANKQILDLASATPALADSFEFQVSSGGAGSSKRSTLTNLQSSLTKVGKVTVTQPATGATLTLADNATLATSGAFSLTLTATGATNVTLPTSGTLLFAGGPLSTPSSGVLTNCTGLPLATGTTGTLPLVERTVSGTTDAIVSTDNSRVVRYTSNSAVTVTIPQAVSSFGAGFYFTVRKSGSGTVTLLPFTSTIAGAASFALTEGSVTVYSDGTNWQTDPGVAFTLTTTGTSGAATLTAGVLNIPQYTGGGGGDMTLAGVQTVTGAKTFGTAGAVGKLLIAGNTSGAATLNAPAVAGSIVVTLPSVTSTLATLGANNFSGSATFDDTFGVITQVSSTPAAVYGPRGNGGPHLKDDAELTWVNSSNASTGTRDTGIMRFAAGKLSLCDGNDKNTFRDVTFRQLYPDFTNTATVGAVTINKACGQCIVAAGASSVVVTCSLCTTSSQVFGTVAQNDTTALLKNIVAGSGSFTVTLNANATANTKINFHVLNQ